MRKKTRIGYLKITNFTQKKKSTCRKIRERVEVKW